VTPIDISHLGFVFVRSAQNCRGLCFAEYFKRAVGRTDATVRGYSCLMLRIFE